MATRGAVIVKMNTAGKVLGASLKTPETRITVVFAKREDGTEGYLNVSPLIQIVSLTYILVTEVNDHD